MASSTRACTTAASRVLAPERTFTAVRAIAPVAGMPPKNPAAIEASPWPVSSRSGLYAPDGRPSGPTMPEATRAESRDSIAASVAMETAGISRLPSAAGSTEGMEGAGRECGSAPIRGMSSASSSVATVASNTAIRLAGRALLSLGSRYITAATPATTASVCTTVGRVACDALSTAARKVLWPGVASVPVARGTCWRKMMAAMPRVKPSTTGQGMKATARPSPLAPRIMTSSPASTETRAMLPTPWDGDYRGQDHHHGAGGAGDLDVGSAHDGRDQPGHHRGDESGLRADAGTHPEGQGQGESHNAYRDAREQVRFPGGPQELVVAAGRHEPRHASPGGAGCPLRA